MGKGASPDGDRAAGLRPQPPSASSQSSIPSAKPRVSLRSYRLLEKLWPYAPQYCSRAGRAEIVADIFDGWMTGHDMAPMIADGLVSEFRSYDPSSTPRLYVSWNPTPKGEVAIFGDAQGTSPGTAKTRNAAEGRSPAGPVAESDAPKGYQP